MQPLLFLSPFALSVFSECSQPHPKWSKSSKRSIIDVVKSIFRLLVVGAHPKLKH